MNSGLRSLAILLVCGGSLLGLGGFVTGLVRPAPFDRPIESNAARMLEEGRQTFRYDTFGDEEFWGGALRLHEAIATISPRMALAVGLKVDQDALPKNLQKAIVEGKVDLDDPAVTLALLRSNAVVGVTGFFTGQQLTSVGIQCSFCHSTVDNSLTEGIGHRRDGWANRDLDVGAIVSLAPNLEPFSSLLGVSVDVVREVLQSWGPGKFDAELILDGKAFRPDGRSAATLIPPAFGMAGVNLHTWTGWGSVTHWNAFVSNLEMHGKGTFFDPRLNDAARFPIAAREGFGNVRNTPDLITSKLAALHFYQLAIPAPRPPDDSFDATAAATGKAVFEGKGKCATCHVPPLFTEPGWNMHTPEELGIDDFQAERSPDRRYRTSPLKGLWTHTKGGFYHDGRFETLQAVLDHYNTQFGLGLSTDEKHALEQYLLSLGDAPVSGSKTRSSLAQALESRVNESGVRLLGSNPARDGVQIEFAMPQEEKVELRVFDTMGRQIAVPQDGRLPSGMHRLEWKARDSQGRAVSPGVYFVRLNRGGQLWTRAVTIVRH